MVTRFGISFVDENARHRALLDGIHDPMEYGDQRAARVRDLIGMGLAAEDSIDEADLEFEDAEAREEFIREAIAAYVEQSETDAPSA